MKRLLLILLLFTLHLSLFTLQALAADPPAPVPKTGQTTTYQAGDDGALQNGVAWPTPRFTDNGNGTVTDNLTGLIWTKNASAPGPAACAPGVTKTWQGALDYAACLNTNVYLGYGDWRVPSTRELGGLVDASRSNPALPAGHPFTSVQSNYYWSGSTYAVSSGGAWYVDVVDGGVNGNVKANFYYYVWPVRSGQ